MGANKTPIRKISSIVSYPERGEGGDNRYRGNCSSKLIEDLIGFFRPSEICDYMCGSGTTKAAAETMGIQSHCYDLHSGFDITANDIPERSEFTFWHPPYWDIVIYSGKMYNAGEVERRYGYDPRKTDLSRIRSWDQFVAAMNNAMLKQYAALEKGGRMAVLMGDIKRKGKLYSMLAEIVKPGTLENILIKAQHNCVSDRTTYSGNFIPIVHEYVMIVRKDNALTWPILLTVKRKADIRDMSGATWKDIVASVLEEEKTAIPLSELYERIEPYAKAKANSHWKEKVRQTLQLHPQMFARIREGVWGMAT